MGQGTPAKTSVHYAARSARAVMPGELIQLDAHQLR